MTPEIDRIRSAIDDIRLELYELEDRVDELEAGAKSRAMRPECDSCGHPRRWHMPDWALCLADGCRCTAIGGVVA